MSLIVEMRRVLPLCALLLVSCAGTVRCDPTLSYSVVPTDAGPTFGLGPIRRLDGAVPLPPEPCGEEPCAAERVVAGPLHTCAVVRGVESGNVHLYCWGNDDAGQVSALTQSEASAPIRFVLPLGEVHALALGRWHTCFVASDGLTCFGANARGVLGSAALNQRLTRLGLPDAILGSPVFNLSSGMAHLCASGAGEVVCRGDDSVGQLGSSLEGETFSVSPVWPEFVGVRAVAAARATCLQDLSALRCWGLLEGRGRVEPREFAVPSVFLLPGSVGPGHVCVIANREEGLRVECLGRNDDGELGRGTTGGWWAAPGPVEGLTEVLGEASLTSLEALAAGGYVDATMHTVADIEVGAVLAAHACAMGTSAVACWGSGDSGQLGQGSFEDSNRPVRVSELPAPADALSLGGLHSCALLIDGRVACWGDNSHGQLGVDPESLPRSATPVVLPWIAGRPLE